MEVTAVPVVVTSTTDDYFVLYVRHDVNGAEVEIPVQVKRGEAGSTTLSERTRALAADRYRVEKYQVACPADVDGDGLDDLAELADPKGLNPLNPAKAIGIRDGAVIVPDRTTFETLVHVYPRPTIKLTMFDLHTARPALYFQNTNNHQIHRQFLEAAGLVGRRGQMSTASIAWAPDLPAPDGGTGAYVLREVEALGLRGIARTYALLAASMPFLDNDLVLYLPTKALPHFQDDLPAYRELFDLVFDEDLAPAVPFVALNPGVGVGRLKALEAGDRPHPRDIALYEALPNELPRVAGIISAVPQTPLSHVNLRAVQDRVPNAYIRDAGDNGKITALLDRYVRYEVTAGGWTLTEVTKAEVDKHYESARPARVQTPERDLSVTAITPLSQVGFKDWKAFGVKAANVAELGKLGFPAGTVPDGFAVPFRFYDRFMRETALGQETVLGKKSGPADEKITLTADRKLADAVAAMLAHQVFRTDFEVQDEMLDDLRDAIKDAQSPQWIVDALTAMHATYAQDQSLRYRSSTNNEDLPGFSGAGLYDSYTQKPEETTEEGIDKSLKQVFASLWTFRAFTEREFHRIDHAKTAMGVLVHPNYTDEKVNGVAVSFDLISGSDRSYYVNSQVGEDLVTNPEPHSVPEEILMTANTDCLWRILALSNLAEAGQLLMNAAQRCQLRRHLEAIHNHFKGLYKPAAGDRFAMEIEFKITSADRLAIKQARPWVFGGGARPPDQDDGDDQDGGDGDGGSPPNGGGTPPGDGGGDPPGGGPPPAPPEDEGADDEDDGGPPPSPPQDDGTDDEDGGGDPPDQDDGGGPPEAAFEPVGAACGDELCRAATGEAVRFVDASTGRALSRLWDFGDGRRSMSPRVEHSWSSPGFYDVTLTVGDGETESSASRTFLVEAAEPAGACRADAWTLCLRDSRYAVAVSWSAANGEGGAARVVHAGTNDSGLFRFFDGDNWEILIKVLDGCDVNGAVWVFAAATTDLGYRIEVVDTKTGTARVYLNEPGRPAAATTDARAFADACAP